ncbi:hypothetical protein EV702DRAFT_1049481 [Suillus placidus]|uniref:Uncharacterized protein n=1 Tax=Suillus placidus TaxID=48579 RepID=A0A9P6ZKM4_9AGAM|nr:hypothetical protein EV702DRAFT_1049481 [Suillus placidus]
MANWTHVFKGVWDEHKVAYVSAKGNTAKRAMILKSIKDTIVETDQAKDPSTKLPDKNFWKYDKKQYDTSDLRSMGTWTKLVQSWYNALSLNVLEELRLATERKIPQPTPEENYGGLHNDGRKNYGWESCPRKSKKTFTLAFKENKKWAGESQDRLADWLNEAEYSLDPEDQSDEDNEKLPNFTVHVNDEGYPCLLTGFESLMLKNQQKVV